jgi:hypothetical protein
VSSVLIQTLECGGVPCFEYRDRPDIEDVPNRSYGSGEFDGSIGLEAEFPESNEYYSGWSQGHREYLKKQNFSYIADNLDEIPF